MLVHTILEIDGDGNVASIFTTFDEAEAKDRFDKLCYENKCIPEHDPNQKSGAELWIAGDDAWSIHWLVPYTPSGM